MYLTTCTPFGTVICAALLLVLTKMTQLGIGWQNWCCSIVLRSFRICKLHFRECCEKPQFAVVVHTSTEVL